MSKKEETDNKSEHNEEEEKRAQLDKEELDKIADEDEEDLKKLKAVSYNQTVAYTNTYFWNWDDLDEDLQC